MEELVVGDPAYLETDVGPVIDEAARAMLEGHAHAVSYTHLRAHETVLDIVCRLLLEKKNIDTQYPHTIVSTYTQ